MSSAQLGAVLQHLRRMKAVQNQSVTPDRELLKGFLLRRDEAAFAELVRRHGPMVLNVCRGVLHNQHDAEDVFQATFLVLAQKAERVRQPDAVGSWLSGVAYHLALKMRTATGRRRRSEEQLEERTVADPLLDMTLRELHQVLLEELQRLPEKYRLPLILCYLEGRTQRQAAKQLGWDKEVLRGRLNRGRSQLRARLTRRGLSLPAGVFASALGSSSVSLPAAHIEAAVKAALASAAGQDLGKFVSEYAAALANEAARTLFAGHGKIVALLVLAVGALITGAGLWARHQLAAETPAARVAQPADKPSPPKTNSGKPLPEVAVEDQGDRIEVRGRVLDPDGKPLAGAAITVWWHSRGWVCWHHPDMHSVRPYRGATSGLDGRFRFHFAKAAIKDTYLNADARPWHRATIVAVAPGYGPAWVHVWDLGNANAKLQLVKDDVAIVGRVRDLQGQPVAGAMVRFRRLHGLDRDAWEGPPAATTTDEQGRYRLSGVGRDRGAVLIVSGPRIESKIIHVETQRIVRGKPVNEAAIEVLAGPTKPIEGTVRAKDTGKPLAGVSIYCNEHSFCNTHQVRLVRAVTDDNGHYRLLGMPKSAQYELTVYAGAGQSYLDTARTVADSEGLKPIAADFSLRRGVPVKFRFLDKRTGQPVRGQIQYEIAQDNPWYAEAVYGPGIIPSREFMHIRTTNQDGYIRFVSYPGPCAIFAVAGRESRHFLPSKLDPADEAKGRFPLGKDDFANGFLRHSHGYRYIDYPENAREQTFDILFDSGVTLKGALVDPNAKPVQGAVAYGLSFDRTPPPTQPPDKEVLPDDSFVARGLDPGKACTLSFVQRERKLIGHMVVDGNEKQSLTVRMRPWGVLTGRLVNIVGKPLTGVSVALRYPDLPSPGMRPPAEEALTDKDGRFRIEGLLPDFDHELVLEHGSNKDVTLSAGTVLKKLKTGAGEMKDLGDIGVLVVPVPKTEKKDD
ncbi:MAG TPA: sigma-70 family RNA polymerase sigma factor [Gemmataceae bacterium]|jgi:RNA polymerase sigma factor (sigma-70 family)